MYRFLVGFFLAVSVAGKAPAPADFAGFYGEVREPEPEPCHAPSYFTYRATHTLTYSFGAELGVELMLATGAYDSIAKKIAGKIHLDFSNGTEESYHIIDDYASGVSYYIYRGPSGEDCYVDSLPGKFPEESIPKGATYVGTSSIGDRALEVDTWYLNEKGPGIDDYFLLTVQKGECTPISGANWAVDPDTGEIYHTFSVYITDFRLGICDEGIFHVPDFCHERPQDASALAGGMRKLHRLSPTFIYVGN